MNLQLTRTYHPHGTNGIITINGNIICYTIELPWKNNTPRISCIPEGSYELVKRFSKKFKHHLLLKEVEDRSLILIHPANNALKELRGCIAPVSKISGYGLGTQSKIATDKLYHLVDQCLLRNQKVFLNISS